MQRFLSAQAPLIAAQVVKLLGLAKVAPSDRGHAEEQAGHVVEALDFSDWRDLADKTRTILIASARAGVLDAAFDLDIPADAERLVDGYAAAVEFADARSAEMVGMKRAGNMLIPNPDARWQITEGTRDMLRATVADAIEQGATAADVADAIGDATAFSEWRANTIARTEYRMAQQGGALKGARAMGATHKHWTTSQDDKVSEECVACGTAGDAGDGVLQIDEMYPSGEEMPPNHPNCRCNCTYLIRD
jgi:hypothetical protein